MRLILLSLLLVGCQSAPSELSGKWSGKVGPFKAAFKFDNTGNGVFCYSGRGENKLEWARYRSGIIYTERKTDVIVNELTDNIMHVEVMNFGSKKYTFRRDSKLKNGSWFCRKYLR